jgi:hypothetical protein
MRCTSRNHARVYLPDSSAYRKKQPPRYDTPQNQLLARLYSQRQRDNSQFPGPGNLALASVIPRRSERLPIPTYGMDDPGNE